ncbi:2-dehydropantoate 2-reductase [Microtetraspora sp. NBRC 13810]|uniref:ketopantoate reductase family protein n=1 Tax=Microtetraspora sp. NBRC 13810 TaxID=3030990 RepID=UPI0024A4DB9B|nr:2-dehydropantoate 2-reductase N-terminal domain-containing protein [Microtetraspora sp. NBRC 13810]GLW09558.1 2-dehydropantoate 2-reductase [Microtetraspora sp. NBRC 13810]
MRYIVIGAGAIGGTIGGRLFESGHEVVLVARGAHHDAMRADGLRLTTPEGTVTLPVPVARGPQDVTLRGDDVLVLAVKTQDSLALLDEWARAPVADGEGGTAGERLPLVCAQNAVENERLALRRFARVYGMCLWLPATHLDPGHVIAYGTPKSGMLHLGRYPGGADEVAGQFAADLDKSSFAAFAVPDVMRWKYAKLLGNLGNAVDALCGRVPGIDKLVERVAAEGRAVLDAAGIPYATAEEERARRGDLVGYGRVEGAARSGGSSWQSLAKGSGSIEADYLNGEIVLLGRLHGVPAPANEVLRRLAGQYAREHRPPGSLTPDELTRLVEDDLSRTLRTGGLSG